MTTDDVRAMEIGILIAADPFEHCTRDPIFIVYCEKRICGMDPDYTSEYVWIDRDDDCVEATDKQAATLEKMLLRDRGTGSWERAYYINSEEFVTACFTQGGADAYIKANKHRHSGRLYVYVDSLYRNHEMLAVREHLKGLSAEVVS